MLLTTLQSNLSYPDTPDFAITHLTHTYANTDSRESLLKRKDQYRRPPCTIQFRSASYNTGKKYFFYKTNVKGNCNKPSPSGRYSHIYSHQLAHIIFANIKFTKLRMFLLIFKHNCFNMTPIPQGQSLHKCPKQDLTLRLDLSNFTQISSKGKLLTMRKTLA